MLLHWQRRHIADLGPSPWDPRLTKQILFFYRVDNPKDQARYGVGALQNESYMCALLIDEYRRVIQWTDLCVDDVLQAQGNERGSATQLQMEIRSIEKSTQEISAQMRQQEWEAGY